MVATLNVELKPHSNNQRQRIDDLRKHMDHLENLINRFTKDIKYLQVAISTVEKIKTSAELPNTTQSQLSIMILDAFTQRKTNREHFKQIVNAMESIYGRYVNQNTYYFFAPLQSKPSD